MNSVMLEPSSAARNGARRMLSQKQLVRGPTSMPSAELLTSRFVELGPMFDSVGTRPFSSRKIPLSDLYEMRTDAVLSYAQLYAKMPLYTARWHVSCKSARKAAFFHEAFKLIYGRFISQYSIAWDFGWSALVKRFKLMNPVWTFKDQDDPEGEPRRVWDGGEDISALVWEPFIPLRPEWVQPRFQGGNFAGINLPSFTNLPFTFPTAIVPGPSRMTVDPDAKRYIPLEHALWIVNERDNNFGSVWGFPRLAFSYKFWWTYELLLAILARSTERKGDPTILVRYPEGTSKTIDGKETPNRVIARDIGQRARSGAVVTMPSEPFTDLEDRPSQRPRWEIDYLTGGEEFEKVTSLLEYLDVQKFRSTMVSELSLSEGSGGSSSRNVAKETGEQTQRMSIVAMFEFADYVNRYVFPQLDERNFPELKDDPPQLTFLDLGSQDIEIARVLFQAKMNQDSDSVPIDWKELAERMHMPVLSPEAIANREKELERKLREAPPPQVAPNNGRAGVTADGHYIDDRGHVEFAEDESFLASLPDTKHYSDKTILAQTRLISKQMGQRYKDQYSSFADHVKNSDDDIELELTFSSDKRLKVNCPHCQKSQSVRNLRCKECDNDLSETRRAKFKSLRGTMWGIEDRQRVHDQAIASLADEKEARNIADRILASWKYATETGTRTVSNVRKALSKIFSRSGSLELKRVGLSGSDWNPEEQDLAEWVEENAAKMVRTVDETTRNELADFLLEQVKEDRRPREIADAVRKNFADFPGWKGDRLARTEVRRFYNAATLFAAQSAGLRQVQAIDDRPGLDPDCQRRHGRFFNISDAFKESEHEHPNGNLAWNMIRSNVELSVVRLGDEDGYGPEYAARFDQETGRVYLRRGLDEKLEGIYLEQVGRRISILGGENPTQG